MHTTTTDKTCKICNEVKPLSEYSLQSTKTGHLPYCKECNAQRTSEWREHNLKVLRRFKTICGCAYCGYREHHSALQFDHKVPRHLTGQSKIRSTSQLRKQILNIQVVCANCHARKTHEEGSLELGGKS